MVCFHIYIYIYILCCRNFDFLSIYLSIWRSTTISMSDKLEGPQKYAIKWTPSEEESSYSVELYIAKCKQEDVLPLNLKFDLNDRVFFHKFIYNLVPVYVTLPNNLKLYKGGSRLHQFNLDSISLISSIKPRSSRISFSWSFSYRTHLLWNKLLLDIWSILSDSEANTSFKSNSMSI